MCPLPVLDHSDDVEQLTVNRLPGEPLGIECDVINGDVTGFRGSRVLVRQVVRGSPAERASGGTRGVAAGDEILSINGVELKTVSPAEILQFVTETPLTVTLLLRRQAIPLEPPSDCPKNIDNDAPILPGYALQTCKPSVVHEGFEVRRISFQKAAGENLGLQLRRRSVDLRTYPQVTSYFSISDTAG